jgi:hypothetical protein
MVLRGATARGALSRGASGSTDDRCADHLAALPAAEQRAYTRVHGPADLGADLAEQGYQQTFDRRG